MLKLLLVDDEKLIRKGLIKILGRIGTQCQVVGEASNGLEALDFIGNTRPDIVITDVKMPQMDGVELIRNIEADYPDIKIIVLSGFDEFNYVRDTMRRGAMDYLLKPVDEEQLSLLLKKIEKDFLEENERRTKELKLKVKLNESLPLLKDQFIRELICGKTFSESKLKSKLEHYNIDIPAGTYYVLVIGIDNYAARSETHGAEDARLEEFIIRNIAEESVCSLAACFSCSINHELVIAISVPVGNGKLIKQVVDTTFKNLHQYSGIRFTMSLGTPTDSLVNLKESYDAAQALIVNRFYNEGSSVITREALDKAAKPKPSGETDGNFFERYSNRLKNCVELAAYDQARNIIDEFCKSLCEYRHDPREAIKFMGETSIKIQMSCPEFGKAVTELFGSDYSYSKNLGLYDTLDEIRKYSVEFYTGVVRTIGEIRKRKDKKLIEVIKDYVYKHYSEDITLNKIADIVFMNPSYVCDLFKNQTGEHFVEFLTRVRIDKAKALLKDVKIKTYTVGQMVGYEDPTYFSKVFKKVVGVSPSEYKSLVE